MIQLIVFFYWSNIVIPNLDLEQDFDKHGDVCEFLLVVISIYDLIMEIPIFIKLTYRYFFNLIKGVNLIAVILILYNIANRDVTTESFWTIQTWAALFLWFRFLLKMRIISKFSWLIRMIIACIADMMTFMVVLIIGVFAFADAFLSIDKIIELKGDIEPESMPEDATFYEKYGQQYIFSW